MNVWTTKKKSWLKWIGIISTAVLIPFIISLIANLTTWFGTKEKVEITFKLDGWISIGSIRTNDLPNLKLMLSDQPVANILKVSWRITNTGNKGINEFESGPTIVLPKDLKIVYAQISDTSPHLKIGRTVHIIDNKAHIDSLGIFNPTNYFRIDFYLKDIGESSLNNQYFESWDFEGKSLDLDIYRDISTADQQSEKRKSLFGIPSWFYYAYFGVFISFILFNSFMRSRRFVIDKSRIGLTRNQLESLREELSRALASVDAMSKK